MEDLKISSDSLPKSFEAEQSVIGGILFDNNALNEVLEYITLDDLSFERHRLIFSGILTLYQKGEPIDLTTLVNHLKNQNQLEKVGGAAYIAELQDAVPTVKNILHYCKIVKDKSIKRRLILSATDIAYQATSEQKSLEDILSFAQEQIFNISESKFKPSFYNIKEILTQNMETLNTLSKRGETITGVRTGFKKLDDLTCGLQRSELIILAARPSMGKTALALNIAQNAATQFQKTVAVFSLEMSKEQLGNRLLSAESRFPATALRSGKIFHEDWEKLIVATERLSKANIYIDDTPAITTLELEAKCKKLILEKGGLDLIIIDYLQLMKGLTREEGREREISEISRSLKGIAKKLEIPLVALSQLNRLVENRRDKRPILSDLRESGAIEQDADVILFIYRDEVYNKNSDQKGVAEIIIGKQRNGPVDTLLLKFFPEYTRFENLTLSDYE